MSQEPPQQSQGLALGADDIIFILIRQKWKILTFVFLAFVAAGAVWFVKKPLYESRAKILVRYVTESRPLAKVPGDTDVVREPQAQGASLLNSEVEILTSLDLAVQTARSFGPSKILAAYGGGTNEYAAAGALLGKLTPRVGSSGVLILELGHPEPEIAQQALKTWIEQYLKKHLEVHRSPGSYEILQTQVDSLRGRLTQTEEQLRAEKTKAGVISLEQSQLDISTQLSALQSALFAAEAELAERKTEVDYLQQEGSPLANPVSYRQVTTNESQSEVELDPAAIASFNLFQQKLIGLKLQERELLGKYQDSSKTVQQVRREITETEKALAELGITPAMLRRVGGLASLDNTSRPGFNPSLDLGTSKAKALALEARVKRLQSQLEQVREQARRFESAETTIVRLQRTKEVDEQKLRYFEANLEQARFDQAIDSSKISNITVLEEPTPARRDLKKLLKLIGAAFMGMIGAGLGLAFATEMFLDRSFKRSKEVEQTLKVPLFGTIPQFSTKRLRQQGGLSDALQPQGFGLENSEILPWNEDDPMLPYYEAIRDRLVMSYGTDGHKPKIVGVTSCNHGAGTTRIAAGLAASLSRDVERNVLYIGLERNRVAVTAFARGRPDRSLPHDQEGNQEPKELLYENLHSLVRSGRNLSGVSTVQSFCDLMPKLKVSDYDFIVFDLPPLSETSGSLRLASQMERTVLVLEAEKTSKDTALIASRLFASTRANVVAVLNKAKSYGPKAAFATTISS